MILGWPEADASGEESYRDGKVLTLKRWHVWKEGFRAVAATAAEESSSLDEKAAADEKAVPGVTVVLTDEEEDGERPVDPVKPEEQNRRLDDECRSCSARVADLMDCLERTLTF